MPFNPFFDNIRQNAELSQGITERIPLLLPASVRHRISELPFTWLQDIALRAGDNAVATAREGPRSSPDTLVSFLGLSTPAVADLLSNNKPLNRDIDDGTESLAMQFTRSSWPSNVVLRVSCNITLLRAGSSFRHQAPRNVVLGPIFLTVSRRGSRRVQRTGKSFRFQLVRT